MDYSIQLNRRTKRTFTQSENCIRGALFERQGRNIRLDQYTRLQALQEKLYDVFLEEADPESWPGRGIKLAAMDAKTRGNLFWCRKTAAAVLVLANRVGDTIGRTQVDGDGPGVDEAANTEQENEAEQVDGEIARYEKQALAVLSEMQSGSRKAAFDRKTHGK